MKMQTSTKHIIMLPFVHAASVQISVNLDSGIDLLHKVTGPHKTNRPCNNEHISVTMATLLLLLLLLLL